MEVTQKKIWGNPDPIVMKDSRTREDFRDRMWRLVLYVISQAGGDVVVDKSDLDNIRVDSLLVQTEQDGKYRFELQTGADVLLEGPDKHPNPWLKK